MPLPTVAVARVIDIVSGATGIRRRNTRAPLRHQSRPVARSALRLPSLSSLPYTNAPLSHRCHGRPSTCNKVQQSSALVAVARRFRQTSRYSRRCFQNSQNITPQQNSTAVPTPEQNAFITPTLLWNVTQQNVSPSTEETHTHLLFLIFVIIDDEQ